VFQDCVVERNTVCESCEPTVEPASASLLAMYEEPEPASAPASDLVCQNHTQQRHDCTTIQIQLQAAQCQSRYLATNDMQLYSAAFLDAVERYNHQKASVMIMEADRKVEWDTLERVICLLMTLTNETDGSASSLSTEQRIEACQTDAVDTSHLDITYIPAPDMGDLPDMPVSPCDDAFIEDAYTGIEWCDGITEHLERLDHGLVTECLCTAEEPDTPESGFPWELGPYLLFNAGFELNTAAGFEVIGAGSDWAASAGDGQYTGQLSPWVTVNLPELDAAFGLTGSDSVAQVAWAYGDPQGTLDVEMHGDEYPETVQHRFARVGGYVYRNAQGFVVALKEISPSSDSLGQDPQMTLYFAAPQEVTHSLALEACPQMFPITLGRLEDGGAETYCWEYSGTISFCDSGCFLFRTVTHGYIAFAVTSAPSDLSAADHYAATDQQGADEHSMHTGYDAGNVD